tara:strand:+ start:14068 stop:14385 length:318 start_codon:yes stop_codon:yes gene_type:complete
VRLFKLFFGTLVLLAMLWILMKNTETVGIDLIFRKFEDVPVAIMLIVTIGFGVLIGYIMALSVVLTNKAESRALRMHNRKLADEINSLRNITVNEGIIEANEEEE